MFHDMPHDVFHDMYLCLRSIVTLSASSALQLIPQQEREARMSASQVCCCMQGSGVMHCRSSYRWNGAKVLRGCVPPARNLPQPL